jgi:hypothetical protein
VSPAADGDGKVAQSFYKTLPNKPVRVFPNAIPNTGTKQRPGCEVLFVVVDLRPGYEERRGDRRMFWYEVVVELGASEV